MPAPEQGPAERGRNAQEAAAEEARSAHDPPARDAGLPSESPAPDPGDGLTDLLSVRGPSILALIRLSRRRVFPPGGEELYLHLARMTGLGDEQEFLVVPCGRGVTASYLAEQTGAAGSGVDPDAELVTWAEAQAKQAGLAARLHYDRGDPGDLPYKDDVFDLSVGELGISATADPAAAVRELIRVTKPMGRIVLIQLSWTRSLSDDRRAALVDHLGARPLMLVEWKRMLRDGGAVDLRVEDWSDTSGSFRHASAVRALGRLFSLRDKLALLFRAWQRWGWRGVPEVITRQRELRRLILQERALGLSVISATKWAGQAEDAGEDASGG